MEPISLETISAKDDPDAWRLLLDCWIDFWATETISRAVPGFRTENGKQNLEFVLQKTYEGLEAPVVIARDTAADKVVGFCINHISHRNQESVTVAGMEDCHWTDISDEEMKAFWGFWINCDESADLFNRYSFDKIFYVLLLSVSIEYRQRGIAKRMMEHSLTIAKNSGFSLAGSNCTSVHSQRIAMQLGFNTVASLDLAVVYTSYSSLPAADRLLQKKCLVVTKCL